MGHVTSILTCYRAGVQNVVNSGDQHADLAPASVAPYSKPIDTNYPLMVYRHMRSLSVESYTL